MTLNTVFTPTRRQKPPHKSPTAAGMREHNRSNAIKSPTLKAPNATAQNTAPTPTRLKMLNTRGSATGGYASVPPFAAIKKKYRSSIKGKEKD